MNIGSAVGRATGVTDAQLRELAEYRASTAFSDLDCLVLDYAVAMTDAPVEVSDDLFRALRSHFDEAQMVELTATIAWENYRARFDHALGIESQGFSAGSSCVLPERPKPDWVPPRS
jgi:alkylhydroperoxidase family enzyme